MCLNTKIRHDEGQRKEVLPRLLSDRVIGLRLGHGREEVGLLH